MSWGIVAGAAISVVGGAVASNKAGKAANAQQAGALAGMESQERMFERSLELQEPYREAGYGALEGLQGLTDPTQRAEMLQGYYQGPEYQQQAAQVEEQQLRNAAATGGVRGGAKPSSHGKYCPTTRAAILDWSKSAVHRTRKHGYRRSITRSKSSHWFRARYVGVATTISSGWRGKSTCPRKYMGQRN